MTGRKQKLTRPRTGRMLSGVCAGLANFFGLDVSLVRLYVRHDLYCICRHTHIHYNANCYTTRTK